MQNILPPEVIARKNFEHLGHTFDTETWDNLSLTSRPSKYIDSLKLGLHIELIKPLHKKRGSLSPAEYAKYENLLYTLWPATTLSLWLKSLEEFSSSKLKTHANL